LAPTLVHTSFVLSFYTLSPSADSPKAVEVQCNMLCGRL
jgi:hypothetical protein